MIKKLLLITTTILTLSLTSVLAVGQGLKPASESEQTLLSKSEIVDVITEAGEISGQQQKNTINRIWSAGIESKTPRSDFLYCTAMAYLGDYKAQACLGRSFENGTGIVSNLTDAYVWYTIALEHKIEDSGLEQAVQSAQSRVKMMLLSVYPAPSDYELEDYIKEQKEKIENYTAEAGMIGH